MTVKDRFLKYVKIATPSAMGVDHQPSTECQFDLARVLRDEMIEMGISGVELQDDCYVTGFVPATPGCEDKPAVGFISHIDTVSDFNGYGVNPQLYPNYDGSAITLCPGRVLDPADFPHLEELKGMELITTDGTTILGADDKAGIAEILTMVEYVMANDIPHGKICMAFTPDEEVDGGATGLDIEKFGADFAYTVDGGPNNSVAYECFNALTAFVDVTGYSIHPGSSKNKMKNASLIAMEFNAMLPSTEIPAHTDGREGFFHLTNMEGDVEKAKLTYIIRDHNRETFRVREETLRHIEKILNEKYGEGAVKLTIEYHYKNMGDLIKEHPEIIDYVKRAIIACGMEPEERVARGGTDGARLTYRGLLCPDVGTGGYAAHGPFEHITVEHMEKQVQVLTEIVKEIAK